MSAQTSPAITLHIIYIFCLDGIRFSDFTALVVVCCPVKGNKYVFASITSEGGKWYKYSPYISLR